jgi:hypothetical protein
MTMTKNAATRTVDRAEARERAKAQKALEKWLPLRKAQVALGGPDSRGDVDPVEALLATWEMHAPDVEVEEVAS